MKKSEKNLITIFKGKKEFEISYCNFDGKKRVWLVNEKSEGMTIEEPVFFDILNKYFIENF